MVLGEIIKVTVTKVHPSYVKVEYEGREATLQIAEITWRAGKMYSSDYVKEGQQIRVKVVAVEGDAFSVSLKEASYGGNPWKSPPRVDEEFFASVVRIAEYGYFFELNYYCHALMLLEDAPETLQMGDRVKVKVKSCSSERQRVEVVPV
ncbi:S1 RNA-binding domain-containing protein [Aliikangiella marina]|uniref:S1 RNA-binding domain-containing protein n=1 Tax=Aliikangiella marina TaxID=1712262 RepID=A0A545TA77_9GAMM|nr:S1 RNA-binding domain-containing protein [Aliikangiella marina]TQV74104.1 S1 RNA-binding domain-containing protein [Aliikangiella marina]